MSVQEVLMVSSLEVCSWRSFMASRGPCIQGTFGISFGEHKASLREHLASFREHLASFREHLASFMVSSLEV
jgi:hypothetical protein